MALPLQAAPPLARLLVASASSAVDPPSSILGAGLENGSDAALHDGVDDDDEDDLMSSSLAAIVPIVEEVIILIPADL